MPFPAAALPIAISAIKALLRYRARVDTILSLKTAAADLPFALPEPPPSYGPHEQAMLAFFRSPTGRALSTVQGLADAFEQIARQYDPSLYWQREALYKLYFEAADVRPDLAGPQVARSLATRGPGSEMRLAYFVVESHRLSRNPAVTRVLLATADTLLEFGAENAGLFTAHPRTQALLRTFLDEFAVKADFDDAGLDTIFKRLLGATVTAALDHPGEWQDQPALKPLFAALRELRDDFNGKQPQSGDNFVAGLISLPGFERLLGTYLSHVAEDPSFITHHDLAQKVLKATLARLGGELKQTITDPRALLGVLETALQVGAANVDSVLARELAGQPLIASVLSAVAGAVAAQDAPFRAAANGTLFADLYRSVLEAVAANPARLANEAGLGALAASLVAGAAGVLAHAGLRGAVNPETLARLLSGGLAVVGRQPHLLGQDHAFANQVLAAVLEAGAQALADGAAPEDLLAVAEAALAAAAGNVGLVKLGDRYAALVRTGAAVILGHGGVAGLLTPAGRTAVLRDFLGAVALNPALWDTWLADGQLPAVLKSVLDRLASSPGPLLSGETLAQAAAGILQVLARQGGRLSAGGAELDTLLQRALDGAQSRLGLGLDRLALPEYLKRVLAGYLAEPFALADAGIARLEALFDRALPGTPA
jgi:hypothetical protein